MSTRADFIERQLKQMLAQSKGGQLELQRSFLARKFECVPSQISYVLETRFTLERGYQVESKRGSGGYIRIVQVVADSREELVQAVNQRLGDSIDQQRAEDLLAWLYESDVLTRRETQALRAVISRDTLAVDLPLRDLLRARILQRTLPQLLGRGDMGEEA